MDYGIYCKICIREKDNKYWIFEGTSLSNLWNRSYYYVTISRKVSKQTYLIIFYSHYCTNYMGVLSGSFIRKIFHTKYWDYSEQKFNFQGRICLVNSICWGILGVIFVKYIHPFVKDLVFKVDIRLLHYIISIIAIVLLADLIVTIIKVKNIKMTLKKVEEINKEIKAKLNEIRKLTKENNKSEEKTIKTENVRKLIRKLKRKRDRMTLSLYKNVYRLKKAFPAINTKEITEILNKKIQIRKNKKNT